MMNKGRYRSFRVLIFLIVCLPAFLEAAGITAPEQRGNHLTGTLEQLDLCIFEIRNGEVRPTVISGSELISNPNVNLSGYAAGLLVLSPYPLTISMDGEALGCVQPDKSGALGVKYYGKLAPEEIENAYDQNGRTGADVRELINAGSCYAAFAPVPGSALCSRERFALSIAGVEETVTVQINQIRDQELADISTELSLEGPRFDYLGNAAEQFRTRAAGARIRLAAISDGIRHIEEMVGEPLVSSIHLIDFKGRNNALTRLGSNDVWLYSQTFWNESPAELRTMIEHEALHILADRCRFSQNNHLRELFADLRGLASLSKERFTLITMGILPSAATRDLSDDNTLLAFINEMNFFKGMKGGHSRDSLDEFFASFLHTLVFIQDLERAVHAPVLFPDRFTRHLNTAERESLLDDYVRVIDALRGALNENTDLAHLPDFLDLCLEHAAWVQERLAMSGTDRS